MSSFLSTLMEDEELSVGDFEIVVDNCKPDHNNSFTSLTLLEKQQPKDRWANLTRSDSDLSLGSCRSGSRRNRSRTNRSAINRPSMKGNRSTSEPCLDLRMPKRIQSPIKQSTKSGPKMSRFSSDTQLLLPQRRPSPTPQRLSLTRSGSRSSSMNASWSAEEVIEVTEPKKKINPFLDIVSKTGDLAASHGSLFLTPSSPCKPLQQPSRKAALAKQMLAI